MAREPNLIEALYALQNEHGWLSDNVLRAYSDLRDEGLIELRRGRGAIVREGYRGTAEIQQLVTELAAEAGRRGLSADEVVAMLRKEF